MFGSTCGEVVESLVTLRDLMSEAPRDVKISGIATPPVVSIAKMSELCRNPVESCVISGQ